MARLRKPDPNVMTKEDYATFSKAYEEGKSKEEIRAALDKANVEQAAKEAAYKPAPEPAPVATGGAGIPDYLRATDAAAAPTGEAVTYYKTSDGVITTTKPPPVTGWRVMVDTIITAFNPFSEDKVVATMGGKTFRTVAEFVANHPYIIALGATGAASLLKGLTLKTGAISSMGGLKVARGTMSLYETNAATVKLTGNMLTKVGFSLVSASVILGAIGSYSFARFELAEAMDKIGMARWKAFEAGDKDAMDALNALQDEILNPVGWEKIMNQIPYANVWNSVGQNLKAAEANRQVFDKLIDDAQAAKEAGLDEDAKWKKIKEDEAAQEKAAVDYYNSERKKMLEWEHEAEAAAKAAQQAVYEKGREAQRAAEIKARNADAAFWAKQEAKQKELEAADRIAIAEFWMAYRKKMQKIKEDSRPSQLNFGLL